MAFAFRSDPSPIKFPFKSRSWISYFSLERDIFLVVAHLRCFDVCVPFVSLNNIAR